MEVLDYLWNNDPSLSYDIVFEKKNGKMFLFTGLESTAVQTLVALYRIHLLDY